MAETGDELLTVDEVAQALRVNPQTVRNWLDRGDLPVVRVGARRVRIRRSDLDAFTGGGSVRVRRPHRPPPPQPFIAPPEVIQALRDFGHAALRLAAALEPEKQNE